MEFVCRFVLSSSNDLLTSGTCSLFVRVYTHVIRYPSSPRAPYLPPSSASPLTDMYTCHALCNAPNLSLLIPNALFPNSPIGGMGVRWWLRVRECRNRNRRTGRRESARRAMEGVVSKRFKMSRKF